MKVLVYVPLAPKTPKIYARTISTIFGMDWDEPLPIVFGREDNPKVSKYQNLADKHNEARKMFLSGDYDALFMVENDMVLPKDTLSRLVDLGSDVGYGLYCSRHGRYRWLAFLEILGYHGISVSDSDNLAKEYWGQIRETKGIGMGCTLISRKVLENIFFRTEPGDIVADDWLFSLDCIQKGYKQVHDFGLVCGHITNVGAPRIIWPDPDAPFSHRIELFDKSQITPVFQGQDVEINIGSFGVQTLYKVRES